MLKQNNTEMTFQIQRLYIKDIFFEAPKVPGFFQKAWQSNVKLDLDTDSFKLAETAYKVIPRIQVTSSLDKETTFFYRVQKRGTLSVIGIIASQLAHCLFVYYSNILFLYARECITNLVSLGIFTQLNLAAMNFDMLSPNHLQQKSTKRTKKDLDT